MSFPGSPVNVQGCNTTDNCSLQTGPQQEPSAGNDDNGSVAKARKTPDTEQSPKTAGESMLTTTQCHHQDAQAVKYTCPDDPDSHIL